MDKWKQFANTLKLKIYLRYVNVDSTTVDGNRYKNKIVALLAENNFLSSDATFKAFKPEETGYNPFYNTFINRLADNIVANNFLITKLTDSSDPRMEKLFTPSLIGGLYKGMASGDSKNHPTENIKNYATPIIGNVSPVYFFTKEQSLFMIAEAQELYTSKTDAEATYNTAILTSMLSLGVAPNLIITYPYNGIPSIIEQKWIAATNKTAIEAFFDFNRTGYPTGFTYSVTSVLGKLNGKTTFPKRLFFPSSEHKSNANTPAKVALSVPVWWAK